MSSLACPQADRFMDAERLKVYVLLAGHMTWRTSDETLINVCRDVDWKRALALHLWYKCAANGSVADALRQYDAAHCDSAPPGDMASNDDDDDGDVATSRQQYACPPRPRYIEEDDAVNDAGGAAGDRKLQDVCYHVLKLYCDRSHDLHVTLNPAAATGNPLDNRLRYYTYCMFY